MDVMQRESLLRFWGLKELPEELEPMLRLQVARGCSDEPTEPAKGPRYVACEPRKAAVHRAKSRR